MWDLETLAYLNSKREAYLRSLKKNKDRVVINPEPGPLAQQVEHWTFNPTVPGSSPGRLTKKSDN